MRWECSIYAANGNCCLIVPFPLVYRYLLVTSFSLCVPTQNLLQIFQILAHGTFKVQDSVMNLFFCYLPNLQRAFISITSFDTETMKLYKQTDVREDGSTMQKGLEQKSPQDLQTSVWVLFPDTSWTNTGSHLSHFLKINVYLFHYVLNEGVEVQNHTVFMPPLNVYELAQQVQVRPCKEVDNWQRKSSLK